MTRRRLLLLGLLAVALAAVVAASTWIGAQARAVTVLGAAFETPVVTTVVGWVTDDPRSEERLLAGVPTTVVRPGGEGPWPAVVWLNGITRRGRHHPRVERLARAFARAGYLAFVPDPVGLRGGELTGRTLADALAVCRAAVAHPDARGGKVGLIGISAGATLALLVAEDPSLAGRISVVGGMAPYADLVDVVRLGTTGYHRDRASLIRYESRPFVSLVVGRSLAAVLPPGPDRNALLEELRAVPDDAEDPLAAFRVPRTRRLGPDGRALVAVLGNRDPSRFDQLFARLPASVHAAVDELSPIERVAQLRTRVELVTAPRDRYFPLAESQALVRAAPDAQLTISATLQHADLDFSFGQLADLARLDAFAVRVLRRARGY